MLETDHSTAIDAPIEGVWDYVQDIRRWADLFPGCRECTVIDDHNSHWLIKVGAGGLVRTVKVQVRVDQWAGPERVDFSFELEGDPVKGSGSYIASVSGPGQTGVILQLRVEASGPMAPMWEAVSRPLLPQLAQTFSNRLRTEIEAQVPGTAGSVTAADQRPSLLTRIAAWWRTLWHRLLGKR